MSPVMEKRHRRYEISKPKPIYELPPPPLHLTRPERVLPPPPPPPQPSPVAAAPPPTPPSANYHVSDPAPWSSLIPRPLSDIRELSEPSLMDHVARHHHAHQHTRHASTTSSTKRSASLTRSRSLRTTAAAAANPPEIVAAPCQEAGSSSYSSTPEPASVFGILQSSVPRRSSSFRRREPVLSSRPSIRTLDQPPFLVVPNHGTSHSPVKQAGLKLDPITSDAARRVPSQTQIRAPHPIDILDFPSHKHPRLKLDLQLSAPVFVGGGSVEGFVTVTVDDNERVGGRRTLALGGLSVDLLGIEQMSNNRKATFLALGTDLIDRKHPPPPKMLQPASSVVVHERCWSLAPSCAALPFMISLPLDTGPPPFQSKHASIRFVLAVTAVIQESEKHYRVRTSQDVHVLPTYDPEKALTSLPSPLTASDELSLPRSAGAEMLKLTAGLHRQVWVSGSSIFVDVHVANKCHKPVKKVELTLERAVLFYKHAAAATLEKSAGQARIFESNEQTVLVKSVLKPATAGWHGIGPYSFATRTCELELPRGHGTVRCGKWFEVRYFLNVTASLASSKLVSVQLPIILIHMNSLDVVPNAVAQVAAAIEEKRAGHPSSRSRSHRHDGGHRRQRSASSPAAASSGLQRRPSFAPGRAFAAPRLQSLDRQREHQANIEEVASIIDSSPRKNASSKLQRGVAMIKVASNTSLARMAFGSRSSETLGAPGALSYATPPKQTAGSLLGELGALGNRGRDRVSPVALHRSRKTEGAESQPEHMPRSSSPSHVLPHTRALHTIARKISLDAPSVRSTTAMSFREKLDRGRFEFPAGRRRASGASKDPSVDWWQQRRHRGKAGERAGWI